MIVIADSGSTKTDWRFVNEENEEIIHSVKTIGFNPYFQNTEFILSTLKYDFEYITTDEKEDVTSIYYYGAGCSSEDKNLVIKNALKVLFVNAKIEINHDLLGASRAVLGKNSGITCILGTGANSCVWDGEKVLANIPSHGYIYGDEGSGSYLGKELLKLFLNNEMPLGMREKFIEEFNVSEQEILESTYKKQSPNVYLASFARFYSLFPQSKELTRIIQIGFNDFFSRRVIKYKDYFMNELGFIGSIAYYFQEDLIAVAKIHGLKIKSIERCPIERLVNYHLEHSEKNS